MISVCTGEIPMEKTYHIEEERHYLVKAAPESLSHAVLDLQYILRHDIRSALLIWMTALIDKRQRLTLEGSRYILQTINAISNGNDGGRHMIPGDQRLTAPAFFWYGHTVWLISHISHWRQEL